MAAQPSVFASCLQCPDFARHFASTQGMTKLVTSAAIRRAFQATRRGAPWQHDPMSHHRRDDVDRMGRATRYTPSLSGQVAHLARMERQRTDWRFIARCFIAVLLAIGANELYGFLWH